MDQEKKLEEQFKQYQQLARKDKRVDVASLMMDALANQKTNLVSQRLKRWAYLISVGLPPFGLFFALRFYFGSEDDGRRTGHICVLLTIISMIFFWIIAGQLFSSTGTNPQQLQQIRLQDIRELTQ